MDIQFGGTIILSIVTNLPEIAVTVKGAHKGRCRFSRRKHSWRHSKLFVLILV